jgi:hypothetical protein
VAASGSQSYSSSFSSSILVRKTEEPLRRSENEDEDHDEYDYGAPAAPRPLHEEENDDTQNLASLCR